MMKCVLEYVSRCLKNNHIFKCFLAVVDESILVLTVVFVFCRYILDDVD